jgi:hypothetical protein
MKWERTVCVVNNGVLDNNAVGAVCIPTIRVGDFDPIQALGFKVQITDQHIGAVDDNVEPLIYVSLGLCLM